MALFPRSYRGCYLNGEFVQALDPNGAIRSRNPGNLEDNPLEIPFSYAHVHEAVNHARRAFPAWRAMGTERRAEALRRYRKAFAEHSEELAFHVAFEVGKPLWEARLEIIDTLRLMDGLLKSGTLPASEQIVAGTEGETVSRIRFHPLGVMAVLPPATEPLYGSHSHLLPCLLYGNTAILKSSNISPLTGQCLAEVMEEAALPAGVVQLIHGDSEVARRLSSDSDLDGIFFTGPFEAGFRIKKQCLSDYAKLLVLEMGGKNSVVIWDDCHYETALYDALLSCFLTSGQRCRSANRLIVHDSIHARFVEDFHALAKRCRVGLGLVDGNEAPFLGPLISEAGMESYLRYQGIAVREGCEEIMRGKQLERSEKGYYVSPSIHLVHAPDPKSVYQKSEIFGPNVAIYRAKEIEEAAQLVNMSQYGLVSSIYTGARENYLKLADDARTGAVHWNRPTTIHCDNLPWGGVKKSGNYRPMGSWALHQCTFPMSSLEQPARLDPASLPPTLPRLEK